MKKLQVFNLILLSVFVSVFCIKIYFFDKVSTAGVELAMYEKQLKTLSYDNEKLEVQLLKLTSLSHLQKEAEKRGFTDTNIEYYVQPKLALK